MIMYMRAIILILCAIFSSAHAAAIERVSVSSSGEQAYASSYRTSLSSNGRFVTFASRANNLVSNDTDIWQDIFVHDRNTGVTERVSVSSSGVQGDFDSYRSTISANGRFVMFDSRAGSLTPGDNNGSEDVFVHDRQTGVTERVSRATNGSQGNALSRAGSMSSDGRYVTFYSLASNLVPGDTNGTVDIFVRDRNTNTTQRVSISSLGEQADNSSVSPWISPDGRYVTFISGATNLIQQDTNGVSDIFVHDRQRGTTERVSISSNGNEGNGSPGPASMSADGRFVTFSSLSSNLVPNDTNGTGDIFVHDRQMGTTERVSLDSGGIQVNGGSSVDTSLSADGRYVVYRSSGTNLVPNDTNNSFDVFVHDRQTGETERVSVSANNEQATSGSFNPSISSDGQFIAFGSFASNLVDNDTNGNGRAGDIFVAENRLFTSTPINLLGEPAVNRNTESGVFIWRTTDGRTFIKVTAGDSAQNGQTTDFEGNIISESMIAALTPIGLETSDSLNLIGNTRIDFDLLAQRPWEDRFSFLADNTQSLCITLDAFAGGLFLGPNKEEVTPPYDINGMSDCGAPQIEINGTPDINRSAETGVFAWVNEDGRTVIKFVAGNPAQGGSSTRFNGNVLADQTLSSLLLSSIEASDTVNQSQANQIDFDVFAIRPWEDRFSFLSTSSQSVCITLDDYTGGLFIGPNKVEVSPPFDLVTLMSCADDPQIETFGSPTIDRSSDVGIFIWISPVSPTPDQWVSFVASGDGPRIIDVDVNSDQPLTNVFPINIESSDVFSVMPNSIDMLLNVNAPWIDGFRFNEELNANTCVSTTNSDVPIFLGPNRVNVGTSINLNTQRSCQ